MIGVAVPDRVETDLAAGAIACPGCGGALRPWGHARARRVRNLATRLLIRRVRLDVAAGQVSADPRSRRRRTLHPDQRALPISELADADAVYGYSFIVTNLDVSTPDKAAATEHWYRHRTQLDL